MKILLTYMDVKKVNYLFIYLFIYLYFFYIDIQGTSFEDDELYEDFMISPSPDQIFRKNKIVCIVYCWKLEITIKIKNKKTNKLLHTFFCISYSISFLCPSISIPKMEQVTDDSRLDHSTDSQISDVRTYPSSSKQKLYSLFVIPIFGIFVAVVIGLLRKYGCNILTNFVRRVSSYVMDISYLSDGDKSVHTPNDVNEMLDEISTEAYGDSSVSSLSWDPCFQMDADIVSQNIKDIAGSLSISHHNGVIMNDQMTQTSIHSMSFDGYFNDSIIDINLKTDISPIELYPSFTAGIQLESSDYDEDLTHPKYIQEKRKMKILTLLFPMMKAITM